MWLKIATYPPFRTLATSNAPCLLSFGCFRILLRWLLIGVFGFGFKVEGFGLRSVVADMEYPTC